MMEEETNINHSMREAQKNFRGVEVFYRNKEVSLIYCDPQKESDFLHIRKSKDGFSFSASREQFLLKSALGLVERPNKIEGAAISELPNGKYFLTYTKKDLTVSRLYGALSNNGLSWKKIGALSGINAFGALVPEYGFEQHSVLYISGRSIKVAVSADLKKWNVFPRAVLDPRKNYFDHGSLSVGRAFMTSEGIALFYLAKNIHKKLCLGAALFDKKSPGKILWRSNHPLWEQPGHWKTNRIQLIGIVSIRGKFVAYFQEEGGKIFADTLRYTASNSPKFLKKKPERKTKIDKKGVDAPALKRSPSNPILEPRPDNHWEAMATFNPAALCIDDTIHLLYRAQGYDGLSVLGYASSDDGTTIHGREMYPAYAPSQAFEKRPSKKRTHDFSYVSGGGWGGCEDPRLSKIDDTVYMTYVAFNGCQPPGVALTSIDLDDFINKRWNWNVPKLLSRPGVIQKNWVLFPEKINGKFAIMHSISPRILIDYFDDLDAADITIDSYHNGHADAWRWDNIMRGVGAPPIRTDQGWLVFYHAMDRRDPDKYKVGAMLLDLKNPKKILYRSHRPILEPTEHYENGGYKSGVVYVCGAVIKDETLFVYYGGSDRCTAVASSPIETFIHQLISHQEIDLRVTPLTP